MAEPVSYDNYLAHYGVKGMKWGVRRDRDGSKTSVNSSSKGKIKNVDLSDQKRTNAATPSSNATGAAIARQKAKEFSIDSLSNKELQSVVTRMNLETQYKSLTEKAESQTFKGQVKKAGRDYINDISKNVVKNVARQGAKYAMGKLTDKLGSDSKVTTLKNAYEKYAK